MSVGSGKWVNNPSGMTRSYVIEWRVDEVLDATDALSFAITSQTNNGAFEIDSATGEIRVADATQLDAAAQATQSLTIQTTDADGNTYDEIFNVLLSDIVESNSTPIDLSLSLIHI